ncbi:MAG: hypothetical protein LBV32_08540, partial [Tannerellaceae bacterium]|nr:hypothetical protein [Tannerellaceae bacterium]
MKTSFLFVLPVAVFLLTGCNGDTKQAQARLDRANEMYEQNEYFGAKNEIDSIRTLYPKEFEILRKALTL